MSDVSNCTKAARTTHSAVVPVVPETVKIVNIILALYTKIKYSILNNGKRLLVKLSADGGEVWKTWHPF